MYTTLPCLGADGKGWASFSYRLFVFSQHLSSLVLEGGCLVGILQASFAFWHLTCSFTCSLVLFHVCHCAIVPYPCSIDRVNCASSLRFCWERSNTTLKTAVTTTWQREPWRNHACAVNLLWRLLDCCPRTTAKQKLHCSFSENPFALDQKKYVLAIWKLEFSQWVTYTIRKKTRQLWLGALFFKIVPLTNCHMTD